MSRSKTVFTSAELPHVFVHQKQDTGRCPSNQSFNGKTYYSYGTPIALLVEGKGGAPGVILNTTSYSVTTSGHQSSVRGAVSHLARFRVDGLRRGCDLPSDGKALRDFYIKEFNQQPEDEPSKYAHVNASRFLGKIGSLDKAIAACKFFGIACKALETKRAKLQPQIEAANKVLEEKENKKKERVEKLERENVKRAIESGRKWVDDDADTRTFGAIHKLESEPELKAKCEAKNLRLNADKIERWRAGDANANVPSWVETLLRREGEEIVTSRGARIPLDHAKKAFTFVKRCHDRKEGFHCNGRSIHVGHYTIDVIDPDGTVRAGCHVIQYPEIEALATREGWTNSPESTATNQPQGSEDSATREGLQPSVS